MIEWFEGLSFMAQLGIVVAASIIMGMIFTFFGEVVSADDMV